LPEEWLERTRRVGKAQNATFTPMLGTALLAKATDDHIDALSLREDESPNHLVEEEMKNRSE